MTLTARLIAKIAFDAIIQTGVGKLTEALLEKSKQLWQKIRGQVKKEGLAESVLVEVEKNKSLAILEEQVVPFLQVAMLKDPQFAQEIQNIAQQINHDIKTNSGSQKNITFGDVKATDSATVIGNLEVEGPVKQVGGKNYVEKKL